MDSGFGRTVSDQSQIHAFGQHKTTRLLIERAPADMSGKLPVVYQQNKPFYEYKNIKEGYSPSST